MMRRYQVPATKLRASAAPSSASDRAAGAAHQTRRASAAEPPTLVQQEHVHQRVGAVGAAHGDILCQPHLAPPGQPKQGRGGRAFMLGSPQQVSIAGLGWHSLPFVFQMFSFPFSTFTFHFSVSTICFIFPVFHSSVFRRSIRGKAAMLGTGNGELAGGRGCPTCTRRPPPPKARSLPPCTALERHPPPLPLAARAPCQWLTRA